MKNLVSTSSILLLTLASAAAHPGHDHSHMSSPEFAWHHLLTGGFVTVSLAAVAWFARAAWLKRKNGAPDSSDPREP